MENSLVKKNNKFKNCMSSVLDTLKDETFLKTIVNMTIDFYSEIKSKKFNIAKNFYLVSLKTLSSFFKASSERIDGHIEKTIKKYEDEEKTNKINEG